MALAEPLPNGEEQSAATADREIILGYPSLWSHVMHSVKRETLPKIGLLIALATIFLAIFGPLIAPYNTTAATNTVNKPPSAAHWFGTDSNGLDVFSRVIAAPRIDISIALLATALALIADRRSACSPRSTPGRRAGYPRHRYPAGLPRTDPRDHRGGPDRARHRHYRPGHRGPQHAVYARLMRSEVLRIRDRPFVEAARASGLSDMAIAWRQVLPNAQAPIVAQMSVTIGWAILATAGLSFLGAGVLPPTPEWGSMISTGASGVILGQWWPSVFPGLAMALTVFGFAVLADTVQTALGREG